MNPDELEREELLFIDPNYLDCALATGDSADIEALRAWCAALPPKSYGHVFVEVEDLAKDLGTLTAPAGVGVTVVDRGSEPAGARAAQAVDAWLDEWLRGDPLSGRHITFWAGMQHDPSMRAFRCRIEDELAEVWSAAADYRAHSAA